MTFNSVEDICGIITVFIGAVISCYYLVSADKQIRSRYPCDIAISKMRENRIDGNWLTLLLNTGCLAFMVIVFMVWYTLKLDTAPDTVDMLIYLVKLVVTAVICRSSVCAYYNVEMLTKTRENYDGSLCPYCPKRIASENNGAMASTKDQNARSQECNGSEQNEGGCYFVTPC